MIYKQHKVSLPKGKSFYLVSLGDIHFNTDECDRKHLDETRAFLVKKLRAGHRVGIAGSGDYNDSLSTSERARLIGMHDFTLDRFDEWAAELSDEIYKYLKPLEGSFVALAEGHHFCRCGSGKKEFSKYHGATNTKYLCDLLKTTYVGTCGYVTLDFGNGITWEFILHHGRGAGQTRAARIAKRKRFGDAFPNAAGILVGHDHDLFIEPIQGIGLNEHGTYPINRYLVGTGSYLRGYIYGRETGTYVEQAMYSPGQLGSAVFEFTIENKKLTVRPFII
jgi:hypothetical protein